MGGNRILVLRQGIRQLQYQCICRVVVQLYIETLRCSIDKYSDLLRPFSRDFAVLYILGILSYQ